MVTRGYATLATYHLQPFCFRQILVLSLLKVCNPWPPPGVCLFQLFQLFSEFGAHLDHSWDQCKSDEKTYSLPPHVWQFHGLQGASKSFIRDVLFKIFQATSTPCGFRTGLLPPWDLYLGLIWTLYILLLSTSLSELIFSDFDRRRGRPLSTFTPKY